jgi:hypothetical protein
VFRVSGDGVRAVEIGELAVFRIRFASAGPWRWSRFSASDLAIASIRPDTACSCVGSAGRCVWLSANLGGHCAWEPAMALRVKGLAGR